MKSVKILFKLSKDPLKNNRGIYNLIMFLNSHYNPRLRIFPIIGKKGGNPQGIALYGSGEEVERISLEIYKYLEEHSTRYETEEGEVDMEGFVDYELPLLDDLSAEEMEKTLAQRSFGFRKLPQTLDKTERRAYNLWRNLRSGIAFYHLKMPDDALRQLKKVLKEDPNNFEANHHIALVYEMLDKNDRALKHFNKALEIDPESGSTHFFLANIYQKQEDFEMALEHYKIAIELDPDVPIIYNNLGWVFYRTGQLDQAIRSFEQAIKIDPDMPFPHNGLGCVLQEKGMLEESALEFETALDIYPDYTAAHLKLGWTYYLMSDYDTAIAEYSRVLKISTDLQYTLSAHYSLAHTFLAKEDYVNAYNEFAQVVEADPDHAEAQYHLGLVALRLEMYEQAIPPLEKALDLDPDINPELHKNLAFANIQVGNYDTSLKYCKLSLKVEPEDPEIFELMGGIFAQQKEWLKSVAFFQKTLQLNPNSAQTHFNLGWAYENIDKFRQAAEEYKRAIQLNPDSVDAYSNLAWLYTKLGRDDEAEILFEKALEIQPNSISLLHNVGWFYTQNNKYDEAMKYYQKALKLDPDNPLIHNNIGIIYLRQGHLSKARSKLELALKLDGGKAHSAVSYYFLGNIALKEEQLESALDYYSKSQEMDPTFSDVYFKMGFINVKLGNRRKGNKLLRQYLKMNPQGDLAENAENLLKSKKSIGKIKIDDLSEVTKSGDTPTEKEEQTSLKKG